MPIELNVASDTGKLSDKKTTNVFGVIHERAGKIIDVLQREITVYLFADSFSTGFNKISKSNKASKESRLLPTLKLCAILYGPAALCEPVGIFAAKCNLYLQHPRHCTWNVPYRNPQSLPSEDGGTVYTFDLKDMVDGCSPGLEVSTNPIDLFADATVPDALEEANTPYALSTELYKHQKQALTFMAQRERGWAINGQHKDIWKEEKDTLGRLSYQNIISGLMQTTPPHQFRGGLLIDAPGLGKSLSILALITSGIGSRVSRTSDHEDSSTTLVIVPKTRK